MKFEKTLIVGLKALAGSIASALIMYVIMLVTAFIMGVGVMELATGRPALMGVMVILFIGISIFVSGWVLNKLWNWT